MKELWKNIKNVVTSKVFLLVVAFVVILYIIFFPHTNTTKVNAELTGVFVTQKERYFLHSRVEFDTEYVCIPGTIIKSQTINYQLDGDIKTTSTVNCDGTYEIIQYNENGTIKSNESINFVGANIRINNQEYNYQGLLESQVIEQNGTITETLNTYYPSNVLKQSSIVTKLFGLKNTEVISNFDDKAQITDQSTKSWLNGVLQTDMKTEYTDGIANAITYLITENNLEASIACDVIGCILTNLTSDNYTVEYNTDDLDYDLLVYGESSSVKVVFTPINEFNVTNVLAQIEASAQVIIDAQIKSN